MRVYVCDDVWVSVLLPYVRTVVCVLLSSNILLSMCAKPYVH